MTVPHVHADLPPAVPGMRWHRPTEMEIEAARILIARFDEGKGYGRRDERLERLAAGEPYLLPEGMPGGDDEPYVP